MAQVGSFIGTTRSRITAIIRALEDAKSLQAEFNALGGVTFTNTYDFGGETPAGGGSPSTYDMTQADFIAGLVALGRLITAFDGGAVTASASALGDLYKAKVS
jgi:hypothetical protein